jgi:GNAT superfamily N-acetyltransferase
MGLRWTKEELPHWDARKRAVFGADRSDVFGLGAQKEGGVLADEWWRVEDGAETVGFGRLDSLWGDAEILLAVAPDRRGRGVGKFVLGHLELEAGHRGLNYVYNTVRKGVPERAMVTEWLKRQGFTDRGEGELRKRVAAGATFSP